MGKKHRLTNILFLTPAVLSFSLVMIVPFFLGIYYSMTDFNGVRSVLTFVGFDNYKAMFTEPAFLYSFLVTLEYTVINVILVNVVAFFLSLLVTSNVPGKNVLRAGFFVPNLIGGIVLGYIWQFIFNNVLTSLGASLGIGFLEKTLIGNKNTVIWAMSFVNIWQYAGYIMMIYVAAIQGIPANLMEAASVDGANYWVRLRKILIPMMANSFTITLFLTLTNSFKMFDLNTSLTQGGPAGMYMLKAVKTSEMLALNIYNTAITKNLWGQGQAKAIMFFIMLVIVSLVQVSINKKKEVEM
ncbi:MAG: sugar ABC transporter permease [Clostridia bacterium]|nr:sugar ABC transporter permease [Clostridia bacterium]